MSTRIALLAAVIALVASAAIAGPALAAKGGSQANGGQHGGKPPPAPTVTLTVSPNPVPASSIFVVRGTGFTPNAAVNFVFDGVVHYAKADASGCAATSFGSGWAGTFEVVAKEYRGKGFVEVGSVTFQVQ